MDECLRRFKLKFIHLVFLTLFMMSYAHSSNDNTSSIIEQGKDVVKDFYRRFSGKEVDLVFILDRSASIPYQGWSSMITFIRSLLEHFSVTGDHTRVAIITYSSHVSMEINDLNEIHVTKCSLMQQIKQRLEQKIPSGYTATYQALKKAQSILLSSRRNAKKSVFVLTDGRSNVGPNPVRASLEIRSLRWNSTWNTTAFGPQVEIYAFGIQDAHLPELKSIASQISNHTFFIPDFKTFANLARQLHNGELNFHFTLRIKKNPLTYFIYLFPNKVTKSDQLNIYLFQPNLIIPVDSWGVYTIESDWATWWLLCRTDLLWNYLFILWCFLNF